MGAHSTLSCVECHTSETNLRFDRIGNECISCHRDDYMAAKRPNHSKVVSQQIVLNVIIH